VLVQVKPKCSNRHSQSSLAEIQQEVVYGVQLILAQRTALEMCNLEVTIASI